MNMMYSRLTTAWNVSLSNPWRGCSIRHYGNVSTNAIHEDRTLLFNDVTDNIMAQTQASSRRRLYHRQTNRYLHVYNESVEALPLKETDPGFVLIVKNFYCPTIEEIFISFQSSAQLGDVGEFMCESAGEQLKAEQLCSPVDITKPLAINTDPRFFLLSANDDNTCSFQSTRQQNKYLAVLAIDSNIVVTMKDVADKQNDADIRFEMQ